MWCAENSKKQLHSNMFWSIFVLQVLKGRTKVVTGGISRSSEYDSRTGILFLGREMPTATATRRKQSKVPEILDPAAAAFDQFVKEQPADPGQGIVPKRSGSCYLTVELRDNPAKEGTFRAFTTLGCPPFLPLWQATHPAQKLNIGALWLREMSTTETILTGSLAGESLVFSDVVETASTDAQGCALESIDLRSFGNDQLLARWREGQCEGGELVLRKV